MRAVSCRCCQAFAVLDVRLSYITGMASRVRIETSSHLVPHILPVLADPHLCMHEWSGVYADRVMTMTWMQQTSTLR